MPALHPRQVFQYISYLQYPLMAVGLFFLAHTVYTTLPLIPEAGADGSGLAGLMGAMASGINKALLFVGISLSFSTLQDPTKTQNKLSLQVWSDPAKGKAMLMMMALISVSLIVFGMTSLLAYPDSVFGELGFGILTMGIAYMSILRVAIDIFEHHRTDRKHPAK
jgi:hypothetical protein